MKLTKEKINWLMFLFGFLALACFAATRQYCTRHMPDAPNPDDGRTIALEANYGKTVYLTASEFHYVRIADGTAMTFGAIAFAVVLVHSWRMFREGLHEKSPNLK
jgi:hypothetical protein